MFGKCATITVRHAVILQILHYSVYYVKRIPGANDNNIRQKFFESCQKIVSNLPDDTFVISASMLERAINLTGYFNKHKLIFCGYLIDPLADAHVAYKTAISSSQAKVDKDPSVRTVDGQRIDCEVIKYMQKILETVSSEVWPRVIDKSGRKVEVIREAMNTLSSLGLGTTETLQAKNGKPWQKFYKIKRSVLANSPRLIEIVLSIGLEPKVVLYSMLKGEESEEKKKNEIHNTLKRKADTNDSDNDEGDINLEALMENVQNSKLSKISEKNTTSKDSTRDGARSSTDSGAETNEDDLNLEGFSKFDENTVDTVKIIGKSGLPTLINTDKFNKIKIYDKNTSSSLRDIFREDEEGDSGLGDRMEFQGPRYNGLVPDSPASVEEKDVEVTDQKSSPIIVSQKHTTQRHVSFNDSSPSYSPLSTNHDKSHANKISFNPHLLKQNVVDDIPSSQRGCTSKSISKSKISHNEDVIRDITNDDDSEQCPTPVIKSFDDSKRMTPVTAGSSGPPSKRAKKTTPTITGSLRRSERLNSPNVVEAQTKNQITPQLSAKSGFGVAGTSSIKMTKKFDAPGKDQYSLKTKPPIPKKTEASCSSVTTRNNKKSDDDASTKSRNGVQQKQPRQYVDD